MVKDCGQDADGGDVNCSSQSDASEHLIDILSGLLSGADAWDVPTKFFHIFSDIIGVKGDSGIKIAEEDDESYIEKIVKECTRA